MIRISKKTKLTPEAIMEKAVQYFSKEVGLKLTDLSACCAYFEGAGGYVKVSLAVNDSTDVEVESRDWEYQAKEFLSRF